MTEEIIQGLAAAHIAEDWTPDRYYRELDLVGFARALLQAHSLTGSPPRSGARQNDKEPPAGDLQ